MKKIIRVTGKGQISVPPDRIRLLFELEECKDTYREAIKASKESVDELRRIFEKLGFDVKELKTTNFEINSVFETEKVKKDEYKQVFKGYKYSHVLKIEFDLDHDLLGKILDNVSRCECHPEFDISYTIKDKEAVKNKLLEKAVKDSRVKAEVLAKAAEMNLDELVSIDYSWGELDLTTSPYGRLLDAMPLSLEEDACYMSDEPLQLEPENIRASDTVTVVWKLRNN
ncbi:SIMPL domain-containing protein [Enterocloster clostridioformis]|uniref:SIMPL domain-containing protein n=1 Tax=Enterocloster clostridioformis TaxID=1531 RepID=UPI0022E57237|nr:SIMPL domain-containing protein [Enterocloster clostridioformis]